MFPKCCHNPADCLKKPAFTFFYSFLCLSMCLLGWKLPNKDDSQLLTYRHTHSWKWTTQKLKVFTHSLSLYHPGSQLKSSCLMWNSDNVALPCSWITHPLLLCFWCYLSETKHDCVHLQHFERAVPKQNENCQQPQMASSETTNPNNMEDYSRPKKCCLHP